MIDVQALAGYKEAFANMAVGAVAIPRALPADAVTALRERLQRRPFRDHARADLAHYAFADDLDEAELLRAVARAASFLCEGRAVVIGARCLRLTHRDYALYADDDGLRGEGRRAEATVDLSGASSAEAQVVYALRGHHFFAVPQLSGCLALVERRPDVTRYDRYLNRTMQGRIVYRVRVALRIDGPR